MYLIISDVVYIISGISKGGILNTLQSYDMTMHKWTTLQPMKEKRFDHAVCIQGDRIIVAGGDSGPEYLDTCEAFHTKSTRFVLTSPIVLLLTIALEMLIQLMLTSLLPAVGRLCRG